MTLIDTNLDRLRYLGETLHGRLNTLSSNVLNITEAVRNADLLIGAVLITGAKAPMLVTRQMISTMQPGSVVIDVAVDQGAALRQHAQRPIRTLLSWLTRSYTTALPTCPVPCRVPAPMP